MAYEPLLIFAPTFKIRLFCKANLIFHKSKGKIFIELAFYNFVSPLLKKLYIRLHPACILGPELRAAMKYPKDGR
jgi:hypothetical protein